LTSHIRIAPSILAADFANLESEVKSVLDSGADWVHVDVMDGQFVPNITMGPIVVQALRKHFPTIYLDVHLMISKPEQYISNFIAAGASGITIHVESTLHVHRALQQIRSAGLAAGLALNPGTPVDVIEPLTDLLDLLLIMTVNPGFGGQAFIPETLRKITQARNLFSRLGRLDVLVEVDGGITAGTMKEVVDAGATVCVAGSAIFSQTNRLSAIHQLRRAYEDGQTGSAN